MNGDRISGMDAATQQPHIVRLRPAKPTENTFVMGTRLLDLIMGLETGHGAVEGLVR
ncbi:MAG: hypothetical protein ACI93T_004142 [Porticoccaceae bacterium]|jgi:hypothetical protein